MRDTGHFSDSVSSNTPLTGLVTAPWNHESGYPDWMMASRAQLLIDV
jgi:hypothetical protein